MVLIHLLSLWVMMYRRNYERFSYISRSLKNEDDSNSRDNIIFYVVLGPRT